MNFVISIFNISIFTNYLKMQIQEFTIKELENIHDRNAFFNIQIHNTKYKNFMYFKVNSIKSAYLFILLCNSRILNNNKIFHSHIDQTKNLEFKKQIYSQLQILQKKNPLGVIKNIKFRQIYNILAQHLSLEQIKQIMKSKTEELKSQVEEVRRKKKKVQQLMIYSNTNVKNKFNLFLDMIKVDDRNEVIIGYFYNGQQIKQQNEQVMINVNPPKDKQKNNPTFDFNKIESQQNEQIMINVNPPKDKRKNNPTFDFNVIINKSESLLLIIIIIFFVVLIVNFDEQNDWSSIIKIISKMQQYLKDFDI